MRGRTGHRWLVIAGIVLLLGGAVGWWLPEFRRVGELRGCQENLKEIATALEMHSTDHGGRFPGGPGDYRPGPGDLRRLLGQYLKRIPTCPAAGRDTYSDGYTQTADPDAYEICCKGQSHPGLPADFPRYNSTVGPVVEDPRLFQPLGGTLPVGVEVDGVSVGMTVKQFVRRHGPINGSSSGRHGTVGGMGVTFVDGLVVDRTGVGVTCPEGRVGKGDSASRVREVLGLPTGRMWDGISERVLVYTDEPPRVMLRVHLDKGRVTELNLCLVRKPERGTPDWTP